MPKIALIQLSVDARPSVNKEKTESAIREAAANGAQIVCTQELFKVGVAGDCVHRGLPSFGFYQSTDLVWERLIPRRLLPTCGSCAVRVASRC